MKSASMWSKPRRPWMPGTISALYNLASKAQLRPNESIKQQ